MQRRTINGLVMALSLLAIAQPALSRRVARRQNNQARRIERGIERGRLTQHEANRLEAQQNKIARDKEAAMADGKVTRAERRHVRHEQNRASRNIFRKKHNGRSTW